MTNTTPVSDEAVKAAKDAYNDNSVQFAKLPERIRYMLTAAAPFMRGDGEAKSPIPPPHWQFRVGRMMQIADLIKELQNTEQKFGNTCVYITGCCWGAVALNRYDDDKKFFIAQKPDKCPRCVERPDPGCDECQGTGNRFAAQDAPGKE